MWRLSGKKLSKGKGKERSQVLLQLFVMSSEESIKKAKSALQKACDNGTSQVKIIPYPIHSTHYDCTRRLVAHLFFSFFFYA